MEFKLTNKSGESHYVTTTNNDDNNEIEVSVTRLLLNGGKALTIRRKFDSDVKYSKVMKAIKSIMVLDYDIYEMVAEHSNK